MRTLIALLLAAGTAHAEPLQSALSATVRIEDLAGAPVAEVRPGEPIRIRVTLENLAGPDAPSGLFFGGWLRPISARNIRCTDAARAYMATNRIPTDAIDLNGAVVAVLAEDQSLTLVDPDLNLASANMIGAATFASSPTAIVADEAAGRFLLTLPELGQIAAMPAFGGEAEIVASGLDHPVAIYPTGNGDFWVQERSRLSLVGRSDVSFRKSASHPDASGAYLAAWGDGKISIFDNSGRMSFSLAEPVNLADAVPLLEEGELIGAALLSGDTVMAHFADALNAPVTITLVGSPASLSPDPTGRWLFAWSPGQLQPVEIVDLARGHVAQAIGATTAISEIRFGDGTALLMMADHSMVGSVDLSAVRRGEHAQVRSIALGGATAARPDEALLVALPGQAEFMAIHPDTFTGFFIHDYSVMGDAPPMSAVRLRGGVPIAAAALDRGFRETQTGTFETVTMVPDETPYELVATTGIGSLSLCIPLPGGGQARAEAGVGRITFLEENEGVRLIFRTADGYPARAEGVVSFSALMTGWRRSVAFRTDDQGESLQSYVLPDIGPVSVTVRTDGGAEFKPAVMGENE